jgi:hypothetical protein
VLEGFGGGVYQPIVRVQQNRLALGLGGLAAQQVGDECIGARFERGVHRPYALQEVAMQRRRRAHPMQMYAVFDGFVRRVGVRRRDHMHLHALRRQRLRQLLHMASNPPHKARGVLPRQHNHAHGVLRSPRKAGFLL